VYFSTALELHYQHTTGSRSGQWNTSSAETHITPIRLSLMDGQLLILIPLLHRH